MQLSNPNLFREQAYIAGKWSDSDSGATFKVINPSTLEVIANVARCGAAETRRAIEAANDAWPAWRSKTAKERAQIMRKFYELIMANQRDLAMIMTVEQGKPLAESMGEVAYGASFVEWFGEEAKRAYGDTIPAHRADHRIVTTKGPIGVSAGITPWNFPIAMITRKASPALAAGCPMIIKPAEATPLSALALCVLAEEAGIPAGILSVITGDRDQSAEIGGEMTSNPIVRKIGFTGSTAVGKLLMKQAAGTVKKVSLELGGNAPFIVFDDADIESALPGAIASKFRNAGQTCVCANRILVQDGIYDKFVDRLKTEVAKMKVGDGLTDGVTIGPLIDERAIAKVSELVSGAKAAGAKATVGGDPHSMGGNFYDPTVLEGVTPDMDILNSEIFGPVAPIVRFKDEADAIKMANDTPFGLAAYFYARDVGRVWRVADGLEYGMVGINTGILSTEVAPFGGVKESGIGREGSKYGLEEWMEIKYLCMGDI
jgi:succinate-semialdehyde dehydrogenase/glutarate-semialdehyde dehydrogenase